MITVGVLAATTAIAGCSSASPEAATPASTTSETSPEPTAGASTAAAEHTSTELSYEDAAAAYLGIVGPYNDALEDLEGAINGGEPLATQLERAADTAHALETEISELNATMWPIDVLPHVQELVAISEQAIPYWRAAADAQSSDELVQAVLDAAEFDGADRANEIRDLLGLDDYDEDA